jgi:hypothetical protein
MTTPVTPSEATDVIPSEATVVIPSEARDLLSPDAETVRHFIRRIQRRTLVLRALDGVAIGIVTLVALALIGRLITRNARGIQSEVILFGIAGIVLFGAVAVARAWRGRHRAAAEIERRAPESRNAILTATELLDAPGHTRPGVIGLVLAHARVAIQSLDPARLFPAQRTIARLAAAVAFWAGVVASTAGHDSAAPITLGTTPPPDEVGAIDVTVTPPSYTRRPTQHLANPSRIEAMAGSRIALAIRGNDLRVETLEGVVPRSGGTFAFTAQNDGLIAIRAGKSARRLIGLTVTPDQTPRVRITAPGKDLFISDSTRRIPVEIDARDDLGLTSLALRYTKVSGAGERFTFVEGTVPVTIEKTDDRDWRAKATLDLGALHLQQSDMVVYRGAATDARPGVAATESDAFIVEITSPLSIAAERFSLDDQEEKYALSQQMVILKTERLLARAATMQPESLAYYSQNIAAEQRSVRAEFVFMMGGEVAEDVTAAADLAQLDETKEAANESELAAGRMVNRGRVALVDAIRQMSKASTLLNTVDPKSALPEEKAALVSLQQAFSRTRYLLRALTQRERLDLSRRLTGVLTLAARDAHPQATPVLDPATASLRRSLAEIAGIAGDLPDKNAANRIAQEVLAVDPSDTTLQRVAARLGESKIDEAATALTQALRARLPREDAATEPADLRRLRGALNDASRGRLDR